MLRVIVGEDEEDVRTRSRRGGCEHEGDLGREDEREEEFHGGEEDERVEGFGW